MAEGSASKCKAEDGRQMADPSQRDLQTFLFDFVENEDDLRVLAWLRRLEGARIATASAVESATGLPDADAGEVEVLERLVAKGLLEKTADGPVAFRYSPPNDEFSVSLDAVLERYRADRLNVLRIMSANSIDRVTLAALRSLAEAGAVHEGDD
jgi:hypothetical protein